MGAPSLRVAFDLLPLAEASGGPRWNGRRSCQCVKGGLAPSTQEVGCVWGAIGIVCGLPVGSSGQSNFLGEWASLRNRTVLLLVCSGPSLPAQLLVH